MKKENYYDAFNNCENISNDFDFFTILEAALTWCGMSKEEVQIEMTNCTPQSDKNEQTKNTFVHPFIPCVEVRCIVLHEAFNANKLPMGRDGGISGFLEPTEDPKEVVVHHISPSRRTIKVNHLKEYIKKFHPDDMPPTLFSEIDISKASPITHQDYLTLKSKNEALEVRLENEVTFYKQQQDSIEDLQKQIKILESAKVADEDLKEVPHQSFRTVNKIMYAMAKLSNKDNRSPYSKNTGSLNEAIVTILQNDGISLENEAVGNWLTKANDIQPAKLK